MSSASGSKNFTEQLILGEILKQGLESACHMTVDGRFYLAGTYICQQAMLAGRIDITSNTPAPLWRPS